MTTLTEADPAGRPERPGSQQIGYRELVLDRRGLTALGGVAATLLFGAAGGLIDVLTGEGLRTGFAICFISGCAFAALRVHREDLIAMLVMPPLVFVVLALLAGAFSHTTATGGWLTRRALELITSLILGAPVLLTATAVVLVIAVTRGRTARNARPQRARNPLPGRPGSAAPTG